MAVGWDVSARKMIRARENPENHRFFPMTFPADEGQNVLEKYDNFSLWKFLPAYRF
jgi:hypothetical protein